MYYISTSLDVKTTCFVNWLTPCSRILLKS